MPTNDPHLFGVGPVLPVEDVADSVEHYRERLGFEVDVLWGDPPTHGSVTRDRVGIQFTGATGERSAAEYPGWTYVFVSDVDALYDEFTARGATILTEPDDRNHGMREFDVRDLDGHRLRFGQYLDSEES